MEASKNGTFTKGVVSKYITLLQQQFTFDPESFEFKVLRVSDLMESEKALKKQIKEKTAALEAKTKETIIRISDEDAKRVLSEKWIAPLISQIREMPGLVLNEFIISLEALANKYTTTMTDLDKEIERTEAGLREMLTGLGGEDHDVEGLKQLSLLLGGRKDEQ